MDFNILHQCFQNESVNNSIFKEFLHKWLPNKVKYLAREVAVEMNTKLRNDDFEELTGQLIILIFDKIEKIEPGIPFRSWVCKAIKLQTRNFIRRKKPILVDTTDNSNPIVLQMEKEQKNSALSEMQLEKLYDSIQKLPHNLYKVFILKYYECYSSQEIAEIIGCTINQVDQRNFRTRKLLKSALSEYFPELLQTK